jgi:hypothetical protein
MIKGFKVEYKPNGDYHLIEYTGDTEVNRIKYSLPIFGQNEPIQWQDIDWIRKDDNSDYANFCRARFVNAQKALEKRRT